MATWNEKLSDELRDLNKVKNPTSKQLARIKALKAIKAGKAATTTETAQTTGLTGVVDTKTGVIDAPKAVESVVGAEKEDVKTNFNLSNPGSETDAFGNKKSTVLNPDGTVTIKSEAGGPLKTFTSQAEAAAAGYTKLDLSGAPVVSGGTPEDRKKAEDANYATLTRFYDRDQGRDMEAAKQELANRGIPFNPDEVYNENTKNLYGKTVGGIKQYYDAQRANAANQSVVKGNETMLANTSASNTANAAFVNAATQQNSGNLTGIQTLTSGVNTFNPNLTAFGATQTDTSKIETDILALSADAYMKKYGIDQDTYTKKLSIAKQGASGGSKSSGSSGGNNSPIIGGDAPGFGV
jgi:hypothetical protein